MEKHIRIAYTSREDYNMEIDFQSNSETLEHLWPKEEDILAPRVIMTCTRFSASMQIVGQRGE